MSGKARSLMARDSTERLGDKYDLESRWFAFSCTAGQGQHKLHKHLQMWYYAGFKRG